MATLGKIRSKGPLLVIVVGGALLAFIAQAAFEGLSAGNRSMDVGEVYGEELSAQEYQKMVEEYSNVVELTTQATSLSDEDMARVKDRVWQMYVNNKVIEHEAEELGLVVSDAEMQAILTEGTHPMLRQTPFLNEQTGLFDKDRLQKFLTEYEKMDRAQIPAEYQEQYAKLYNFWMYTEKALRQARLAEKYQRLVSGGILTNKVEAEANYNDRVNTADFVMAAVSYNSVPDAQVKVEESDLKAIYDKKKPLFRQYVETRDIKFIDVQVKASAEDRAAIEKEVKEAEAALAAGNDYKEIVRNADSEVNYFDLYYTKDGFTSDVAQRLEAAVVGQVVPTFYTANDNTLNTFKVVSVAQEADSIKFRQIPVARATEDETKKLADSISTALKSGANFAELAKKYGGMEEGQWIATKNYEGVQNLDATTEELFATVFAMGANEVKDLAVPNGRMIIQVQEKKNVTTKYKVALVKREVAFSKETYSKAYNKLSSFLASNPTIDQLTANAEKNGFRLQERNGLYSDEYYVGGVRGTHEALRWVFQAEPGAVSAMYECGDNDHLFVVALTGINEEGYVPFEKVKEMLHAEALRDKKAEKILADIKKANPTSMSQCSSISGAVTDSLKHVSYAMPSYVSATHSSEPLISAYAETAVAGKLSAPIKGNGGVYMLQLLKKQKTDEKFNAETERQRVYGKNMQLIFMPLQMKGMQISRFMNDLYLQADMKDDRYLYF